VKDLNDLAEPLQLLNLVKIVFHRQQRAASLSWRQLSLTKQFSPAST